jgi:hypothetical protein
LLPSSRQFHRTLEAAHLQDMADRFAPRSSSDAPDAGGLALARIGSKAGIALLRHCDLLAADRAFHDAGACATNLGWHGAALVFLLRFLDLADAAAADDDAPLTLDNAPLARTDIPSALSLPPAPSLPPAETEAARGYVLLASMDEAGGGVPLVECAGCLAAGAEEPVVYAAAASCPSCGTSKPVCLVTGFPLTAGLDAMVRCTSCDRLAGAEDWNAFWDARGCCAWCASGAGCEAFE